MKKITNYIFALILLLGVNVFSQNSVTVSGLVKSNSADEFLAYSNVSLKTKQDGVFVLGTISDSNGRFTFNDVKNGQYIVQIEALGFKTKDVAFFVGNLAKFLDLETILLEDDLVALDAVELNTTKQGVSNGLEKKTFSLASNISQSGGSVLQAMQSLPSVTVQDGKVALRGNEKVAVLIDGKQTALTGFGNQSGLDNIPASAIEKIEIINNPSAKYDANGNAGIINIIYKKENKEGLNGKVGLVAGAGSLWERRANFPNIRPQYTVTPKINPSVSLNYKKNKINTFLQADYLYNETLNRNEYVYRVYDDGTIVNQQLKRNRDTHYTTLKAGVDYEIDDKNTLSFSALYGSEIIIDNGDEPFYNQDFSNRLRLWQFLEDEVKTTVMASANFEHKFNEPGRLFEAAFNYTFHREDEKYFYTNYDDVAATVGDDAFKLLSDEQVFDLRMDYVNPLKYGSIETGLKFRYRTIPTNMDFIPGANSVIDLNAGGQADYKELIPAVYANYVFENEKWETELGLRVEYVNIQYDVNPNHIVYKSDGYNYTQPFPNFRIGRKFNEDTKLSLFFTRRVDRPNEVDIRIFPKYDDAEIIKVGNPALRPQFTHSVELGFKRSWEKGYLYNAVYHKFANGTTTRISSTVPGSDIIYATFQNAGKSYNSGVEMVLNQKVSKLYSFNVNANVYRNQINAFSVENKYPVTHTFSAAQQDIVSWNVKWNNSFQFKNNLKAQLSANYLAPDIIPQGTIASRFSLDMGLKKTIQKGQGELFVNASDLLNTMRIKKEITGEGFYYTSENLYETQVVKFGYSYKF
ncbi:TonB-dependent receptor [Flavobacteriaceae bacterium]|nr:TonB-dependent receptor [Flavobacteriaceae bacterium]